MHLVQGQHTKLDDAPFHAKFHNQVLSFNWALSAPSPIRLFEALIYTIRDSICKVSLQISEISIFCDIPSVVQQINFAVWEKRSKPQGAIQLICWRTHLKGISWARKFGCLNSKAPFQNQKQTIAYKKRARCNGWNGVRRIKLVHYTRCNSFPNLQPTTKISCYIVVYRLANGHKMQIWQSTNPTPSDTNFYRCKH
jgi:hypothetical protein